MGGAMWSVPAAAGCTVPGTDTARVYRFARCEAGSAPDTTVNTTLPALYVMVKCSLPLIARPLTVAKVVLPSVDAVRMVNVCPTVGVNPLPRAMFSVPPSVAAWVTLS